MMELSVKMKAAIFLYSLLIIFAEGCEKHKKDANIANTPLGKIRGSTMTSRLGKKIYSFRGIRYAEPPIGDLRFKQAVPVNPWAETFDASEDGPMCPQPRWPPMLNGSMSEDCLRLNIYTTKLPSRRLFPVGLPVIVFFHPGGFFIYSGQSMLFGPEYLLDKNVILVTANYRLATLGFISTGDSYAPGNLGYKDQVEVLRFVQKNIRFFGGDPNSVTIAGQSAGSWSNVLHMLSPMSRGLFHRVIAMSGSPISYNILPHHQKDIAEKQARFVGCPTDDSEKIINCLKTKTAEEIAQSLPKFQEWRGNPLAVWVPVVEPEIPGVERFLTAQPVDLIRQGKFYKVPVITGVSRDEFAGAIYYAVEQARKGDNSIFDDWNANWTTVAPIAFVYERDTPRSYNISEELRQFYLKGQPASLSNYEGLARISTDDVVFANHRFANLIAQYSNKPVYYYKFTYQGRYSWITWSDKKPVGVAHQDDLMYLFHIGAMFPFFDADAPEISMIRKMTSMWANFAWYGQPIPMYNEDFAGVSWTPLTPKNQAYMDINDKLEIKTGLYLDRMKFWERVFPLDTLSESKA